jgi:lipopolysaccharide/colanic/teichoic acid biosynthesis glycosyltransferase
MIFDRIVAIAGLVVLGPILLIAGIIVRLTSSGPALFIQERIGRAGHPFKLYKFRTMTVAPPSTEGGRQVTLSTDRRITRVGSFLRIFKLDEIPQLLNVLLGDMRLVGPRPEVARYTAHYTDEQRRVLDVLPGITDVATLYFRNESEELADQDDPERYYIEVVMPRKLELNHRYLSERSFLSDLIVIMLTACVAVSPSVGANVRRRIARRYGIDDES